jgi:hypothetical protein
MNVGVGHPRDHKFPRAVDHFGVGRQLVSLVGEYVLDHSVFKEDRRVFDHFTRGNIYDVGIRDDRKIILGESKDRSKEKYQGKTLHGW